MRRFVKYFCIFIILALTSGCATAPPANLEYRTSAVVETLASSVSLSIHASDSSMAGNGFMVFRRPDRMHLVVLSPFGTTVLEAFVLGDRITLVYPSQMTAYSGRFDELPDKGGLQGWRLMRWVMDADPANNRQLNETLERVGKLGFMEKVTFRNGLVTSKLSPLGDQVYYGKYSVVNGVPLAAEVEMRNAREDRIRLTLDEPEVNSPVEDAAFTPRLDGMTIYPLSALQHL
jgi:hypothetical protein